MHQFEHRASTSIWRGATIQQLPSLSGSGSSLESHDAALLSRDVHVESHDAALLSRDVHVQSHDAHMQSGDATVGAVDGDDDDIKFFDAAEIIPEDKWGTLESPTESFQSAIMDFPSPIESGPPAATGQQLPVGKENTMIVSEICELVVFARN